MRHRKKRIGIDATKMLVAQKTGIEHYITQLVLALAEQVRQSSDIALTLYFHAGNPYVDPQLLAQYAPHLSDMRQRVYRPPRGYGVALPAMAFCDRLDLLHLPEPSLPRFVPCWLVITLHDVAWKYLPSEGFEIEGVHGASATLNTRQLQRVKRFIAVSESTKADMAKFYEFPASRIDVVYHGVESRLQRIEATMSVLEKYGLGPYILNVGALQYRKNQVRLLQAFAELKRRYQIPHTLVIAGREGWGYEAVYAEWRALGLGDAVRFLGYVPDADIPVLYSAADLVVYPSLYEGFGLPVLEAMACGAIVATSNVSSLPEVGGEAALYFDPQNVTEMAETIYRGLTDTTLRAQLRRKGLEHVRAFTWEQAAKHTLNSYRQALLESDANA